MKLAKLFHERTCKGREMSTTSELWAFQFERICGKVQIPCGLMLIILWKKQRMYQITMERLESLEHKYCDKLSYIW